MSMGRMRKWAYPSLAVLLGILLIPSAVAQKGDDGFRLGIPGTAGGIFEIDGVYV